MVGNGSAGVDQPEWTLEEAWKPVVKRIRLGARKNNGISR